MNAENIIAISRIKSLIHAVGDEARIGLLGLCPTLEEATLTLRAEREADAFAVEVQDAAPALTPFERQAAMFRLTLIDAVAAACDRQEARLDADPATRGGVHEGPSEQAAALALAAHVRKAELLAPDADCLRYVQALGALGALTDDRPFRTSLASYHETDLLHDLLNPVQEVGGGRAM